MGTWKHIKFAGLPLHNTLGFFCWGRSLKNTHRNKKAVVYTFSNNTTPGA
jgi:hypothetical protein